VGKRLHRHPRCERCKLFPEHCLCAEVEPLELSTRIAVVMHRRELGKPSNTGRLALLMFPNSELHVRGHRSAPADLSTIVHPERRIWVLFPSDDAVVMTRAMVEEDDRPITLVVPDGTWAQTRRAVRREPVLRDAVHLLPPPGQMTRYRLRSEHVPGGLATAEAVARALGVIEGTAAQRGLERLFEMHVERVLLERNGRHEPK